MLTGVDNGGGGVRLACAWLGCGVVGSPQLPERRCEAPCPTKAATTATAHPALQKKTSARKGDNAGGENKERVDDDNDTDDKHDDDKDEEDDDNENDDHDTNDDNDDCGSYPLGPRPPVATSRSR